MFDRLNLHEMRQEQQLALFATETQLDLFQTEGATYDEIRLCAGKAVDLSCM